MKYKVLTSMLMLVSFMLVVNASLISASDTNGNPCSPTIQIANQDPTPAVPNDYVKVVFEIDGLVNCNGYAVKLNPEYPFSLDPNSESIQTIAGGSYVADYKNTWMVPYKIRVADDALEGDYQLKLDYHEGASKNFDSAFESGFNVSITDSQTDFDVVIQDVSGSQVSLGIVNTGKNTANSLVVKIPQQDNFRTTGISEQILGNLAAGDYSTASFSISSARSRNMSNSNFTRTGNFNPNLAMNFSNSQDLKVQIDYTDGIGKRRTVIKDIQAGSLISGGNFTSSSFRGSVNARSTSTSSKISFWWYILGIIIIIAGIVAYRNWDKIKAKYHSGSRHKGSDGTPDWVSAERTRRKK